MKKNIKELVEKPEVREKQNNMKKNILKTRNFDSVQIKLASPDDVLKWSFGKITKPETINYRTQLVEPDGLFCPKIFGPENDFQCSCGKYKGVQYHGIICDKCGVEVTKAIVRRERMGHIELATPIAHHWFLNKVPSRLSILLGLPTQKLKSVVYYSSYYVTFVDEVKRQKLEKAITAEFEKQQEGAARKETKKMFNLLFQERVKQLNSITKDTIISEQEYETFSKQFPGLFKAEKGGQVIYDLLKKLDLKAKESEIKAELKTASAGQREKLNKQLMLIRSFLQSGNKPEWMFITHLPVIPPGIRPIVPLDGGRYASSDLNDLYRHIIVRNNRLQEFFDSKAPDIFINTQKRLVQEAVDALFEKDTNAAARSRLRANAKQLKPISEFLAGKSGYFRSNLLGKRVDFTGRTVIVVGPHLKLNEFGIPKTMALEIFRPFVIAEILKRELAYNVRGAQRLIDSNIPVIWGILEQVIEGKYMLLNRQPSLHRQSIQAFKPILVEGLAIELHPLVCEAYNADFDGDTMVTYLPLSAEAQAEAKNILISSNNIIKPSSGSINTSPATRDIILGAYWATKMDDKKDNIRVFGSLNEALSARTYGLISFQEKIKIKAPNNLKFKKYKEEIIETTAGRIRFNLSLPESYPFVNEVVTKKLLNEIIKEIFNEFGREKLVLHLDLIKYFGFYHSSKSGITFSWEDLTEPKNRDKIIDDAFEESDKISDEYKEGYISLAERKRKNINLWHSVKADVAKEIKENMSEKSDLGSVIKSGARGSFDDLTDMSGIFGIVDSASGEPIEQPITSSLKIGLSPIEYFNASFGGRKGAADTALKTADAGFLSRKLFDVAQEINIEGKDCETTRGYRIYRKTISGGGDSFSERIYGRYSAEDIVSGKKVIVKKNKLIDFQLAKEIEKHEDIESVKLRSPITCRYTKGVCSKCYGYDRTTNELVDIGEPVGTIAAQSVGEPGTQLTMRTFHAGGAAVAGGDITVGLPRVTEIFETRIPKNQASISHVNGVISKIEGGIGGTHKIYIEPETKTTKKSETVYDVSSSRFIEVKVGDYIKKGQFLTDGSADLNEYLKFSGVENTQEYIFSEISKVYELQGVSIAPVHFEIIIRQMFSRLKIVDIGDSDYALNEVVEMSELAEVNDALEKKNKKPIKAESMITGITNVSISRNNFLSAASFQNTTNVLIRAAISGAVDTLDGVKENVIVGRLVPIGTGNVDSKKNVIIDEVKKEIQEYLDSKAQEE